ncbi:MAG TPA: anti-sigma factor [Bryobacteraceae bacterium]|jgi:hypothetical protein|nr:anti-sigma factor [Bryobacteraceae bacterium]
MSKFAFLLMVSAAAAMAQNAPDSRSPLYKVTVVSHTTKAINYGHRTEPTRIGFRGTVLMPDAKGEAVVESKRGVVEVDAKFQKVGSPQRFGLQYLTYVVWAITPEGKAQNLGELVLNGSDKGKLRVSANLQSFALIVTAEPYYSVAQPSGVVVMENQVLPETVGKVEEVDAKYDLLPVKPFDYDIQAGQARVNNQGPKLSMDQYEAVQAMYQALNAIQMAAAAGADQSAADTMRKARNLYEQARQQNAAKADPKQIVATAREAVQAAEDARAITQKQNDAQPAESRGSR